MKMNELKTKELMMVYGVSQDKFAKELGVSRALVSRVIKGTRSNKKVRQAIAEAVGRSVEELWGEGVASEENDIASHPENIEEVSIDERGKDEEVEASSEEKPKAVTSIYNYYKSNENSIKGTMRTVYRRLLSGQEGKKIYVERKGNVNRYYVQVDDPLMAKKIIDENKLNEIIRKHSERKTKIFYIKISSDFSKLAEKISSPIASNYEDFFEVFREENRPYITLDFAFHAPELVRKKMTFYKADYQRISEIAKSNRMEIGKIIEIGLRSLLAQNFTVSSKKEETDREIHSKDIL